MADFVYRVTFADGSMCHTGYRPLAVVWAKTTGSKLEEIELKSPTRLRIVNSGDNMADCYERAFTGANRRPAMWVAFRAGWEAAMRTGEPSRNQLANHGESSSSPVPASGVAPVEGMSK